MSDRTDLVIRVTVGVMALVGACYLEWWGPACHHFWGLPLRFVPARCVELKR